MKWLARQQLGVHIVDRGAPFGSREKLLCLVADTPPKDPGGVRSRAMTSTNAVRVDSASQEVCQREVLEGMATEVAQ